MRMISKLLSGALTLALAVGVFAVPAFADEGAPEKTYRVTLYAGEQGTVNGTDKIAFDVAPGASVSFDGVQIAIKDGSKYYAWMRRGRISLIRSPIGATWAMR